MEKSSLYFLPSYLTKRELTFVIKKCPHIISLTEKQATLVEIILKNMAEEINDRQKFWDEMIHSEIALFLSIIKRCSLKRNVPIQKNPIAEKIIDYVEQNFAEDLSLSDISKSFSLSASRVSHIFKEETGLSLKHYILQRRIVEAKKLLEENSNLKVKAISIQVGYNDFYLFNRSFKKITGLTPTYYRRSSKQSPI